MGVEVRCLAGHEWLLLRSVRLRALRDSASIFATSADVAGKWPASAWKQWLETAIVLVATDAGQVIGMVSSATRERAGDRGLAAMWVAPEHRGAGVGDKLVRAFLAWAHSDEADRVTLWVSPTNAPAWGLYQTFGFVHSGAAKDTGHGEVVELTATLSNSMP